MAVTIEYLRANHEVYAVRRVATLEEAADDIVSRQSKGMGGRKDARYLLAQLAPGGGFIDMPSRRAFSVGTGTGQPVAHYRARVTVTSPSGQQ